MKFLRQDAHKKVKLGNKWRKPKGWQNKVRLSKKSYRKMPRPGYGSPKKDDVPVFVSTVKELEMNTGKTIMLAKIGMKKKLQIINAGIKTKAKFGFDAVKLQQELQSLFDESSKENKAIKQEKQAKEEKDKKNSEKKEAKAESKEAEATEEEKKKELDKKLIHTK
jgi:hypothetical protein